MVTLIMSEEIELKLKRRVQITVIAAMSLFFVLVVVVVFQFAIRIYQESEIRALARSNEALYEQRERAKRDIEYIQSEEFILDQAMQHHNRGRPGDIIIL
jgi:cell division protein FtsB